MTITLQAAAALILMILLVGGLAHLAQAGPVQDSDGDGTLDPLDFCSSDPTAPTFYGCDYDHDGYGNHCDGDFNNDGAVNLSDIAPYLAALTTGTDPGDGTDMNCDGAVNLSDTPLFILQLQQGFPGPSGLSCAGTVPCP